jgi:uncharacterized protein
MPDSCPPADVQTDYKKHRSEYDTHALADRARQWRMEADAMTSEAMRSICLTEADKYEQRLRQSFSTPVIRETDDIGSHPGG